MAELKVHMHLDSSELQFVLDSISKLNIPVDMAPEVHRQSEKITSFCEFKTCRHSLIGISSCFVSIVPSEQLLDLFRWLKTVSEPLESSPVGIQSKNIDSIHEQLKTLLDGVNLLVCNSKQEDRSILQTAQVVNQFMQDSRSREGHSPE